MKEQKLTDFEVFNNEEFGEVNVLYIGDKSYFEAVRVAEILGYKKPHDAISRHCRYSVKHGVPHPQSETKTVEKIFIDEGDLYRLIVSSKLPSAEKFERWVFDEVLPSIRKHGMYITQEKLNLEKDELMKEVERYKELNNGANYRAEVITNILTHVLQQCLTKDQVMVRLSIEFGISLGDIFEAIHDGFIIDILEDEDKDYYHIDNNIGWTMNSRYENQGYTVDVPYDKLDSQGNKTGRNNVIREFTGKAYELIKSELLSRGYKPVLNVKTRSEICTTGSGIIKTDPRDFIVFLERPSRV